MRLTYQCLKWTKKWRLITHFLEVSCITITFYILAKLKWCEQYGFVILIQTIKFPCYDWTKNFFVCRYQNTKIKSHVMMTTFSSKWLIVPLIVTKKLITLISAESFSLSDFNSTLLVLPNLGCHQRFIKQYSFVVVPFIFHILVQYETYLLGLKDLLL